MQSSSYIKKILLILTEKRQVLVIVKSNDWVECEVCCCLTTECHWVGSLSNIFETKTFELISHLKNRGCYTSFTYYSGGICSRDCGLYLTYCWLLRFMYNISRTISRSEWWSRSHPCNTIHSLPFQVSQACLGSFILHWDITTMILEQFNLKSKCFEDVYMLILRWI